MKYGFGDIGGNGEGESSRRKVVVEVKGGGGFGGKRVAERAAVVASNWWVRFSKTASWWMRLCMWGMSSTVARRMRVKCVVDSGAAADCGGAIFNA